MTHKVKSSSESQQEGVVTQGEIVLEMVAWDGMGEGKGEGVAPVVHAVAKITRITSGTNLTD